MLAHCENNKFWLTPGHWFSCYTKPANHERREKNIKTSMAGYLNTTLYIMTLLNNILIETKVIVT